MREKTPALASASRGSKGSNIPAESTGRVNIHVQQSQGSLFKSTLQNRQNAETLRSHPLSFLFLRKEGTSVGSIHEIYNAPHILP